MDLQLEDTDTLSGLEDRILRAVQLVGKLKEENAGLKERLAEAEDCWVVAQLQRQPVAAGRRQSRDGVDFYARNNSNYNGEFTHDKRHFFVLEQTNIRIFRSVEYQPDGCKMYSICTFFHFIVSEGFFIRLPTDHQVVA